jgi:hypothetical protein
MRDAHQQVPFGRVARAEDPLHVLLAFRLVARLQEPGAEQVRECQVVTEHRLARLQQRDRVLRLPCLQIAVGEEDVRVLRLRLHGNHLAQVRNRLVRARGLVIREREIRADGRLRRIDVERRPVLRDRIVVLPEPRVRDAQVGQRVGALRIDRERGLVGFDRAEHIACLLQLHRAREEAVEVGRVRRLGANRHRQQERGDQESRNEPDHRETPRMRRP